MKRFIFVTTKIEGLHRYPAAPDEVSYLRNLHRHLFGVKVKIEVFHNDRDLEFIMVKHVVENYLNAIFSMKVESISCEMIANDLYEVLKGRYGKDRLIQIEVDEDSENGVILGDSI